MKTVQLVMFAEYPTVNVIPSSDEAIEIDTVAPILCEACGTVALPYWHDNTDEWHMPCHYFICGKCEWSHDSNWDCSTYQNGMFVCDDCYEPRPEPEYDDDTCNCDDCRSSYGERLTPGWIRRGVTVTNYPEQNVKKFVQTLTREIDPSQMMAEFYAADYAMAVTGNILAMARPYGANRGNVAYRDMYSLYDDAKRCQDYVIAQCDRIFRDYLLGAIGGEVRHYHGTGMPEGRSSAWNWFVAAAVQTDRVAMIRDCVELFHDYGNWDSGFGGRNWEKIADILLSRETGKLDAKTFVDRVFTLQHNGGSALNKCEWKSYLACEEIGNAHAAEDIDFGVIFSHCGKGFIQSLFVSDDGYIRIPTHTIAKAERVSLTNAIMIWSDIGMINDDCKPVVPHDVYLASYGECKCDGCNDPEEIAKAEIAKAKAKDDFAKRYPNGKPCNCGLSDCGYLQDYDGNLILIGKMEAF